MNRSQGMDRQRSNFYWPNDSDAEESRHVESKKKGSRLTAPANNIKLDTADVKPKELFQKQLASGIAFYDNVNAKTPESRRRRFKKIENINLTNVGPQFIPEKKKLETFSSKIEFYDFMDEVKSKDNRNNESKSKNSIGKDVKVGVIEKEMKLPERSDSIKKRISFKPEVKEATMKGILKNSEMKENASRERIVPIDIAKAKDVARPAVKRTGLAKKSLSKSVDNIPRLAKDSDEEESPLRNNERKNDLASVVRDVKNLQINEKPKKPTLRSRYADFDDVDQKARDEPKKINRSDEKHNDDRRSDDKRSDSIERNDNYDTHRSTKQNGYSYDDYKDGRMESRNSYEKTSSKNNKNYDEDYYKNRYDSRSRHSSDTFTRSPPRHDNVDTYAERRTDGRSYRSANSTQDRRASPVRSRYENDHYDRYNNRQDPSTDRDYRQSNGRRGTNDYSSGYIGRDRYEDRSPRRDRYDYDQYDRSSKNNGGDYTKDRDGGYERNGHRDRRSPPRRYSPERGQSNGPVNQSVSGAHRHLQSTFSFNNNQPQQNRPLSVRQSAVHRVGVGLPDF